jgi:hypothetical protein
MRHGKAETRRIVRKKSQRKTRIIALARDLENGAKSSGRQSQERAEATDKAPPREIWCCGGKRSFEKIGLDMKIGLGQIASLLAQGPAALIPFATQAAPNAARVALAMHAAHVANVRLAAVMEGATRAMAMATSAGVDVADANHAMLCRASEEAHYATGHVRALLAMPPEDITAETLAAAWGLPTSRAGVVNGVSITTKGNA